MIYSKCFFLIVVLKPLNLKRSKNGTESRIGRVSRIQNYVDVTCSNNFLNDFKGKYVWIPSRQFINPTQWSKLSNFLSKLTLSRCIFIEFEFLLKNLEILQLYRYRIMIYTKNCKTKYVFREIIILNLLFHVFFSYSLQICHNFYET